MPKGSPVAKYHREVLVSGVRQHSKALRAFNEAWGFPEGACNEYVGNELVEKPYPEGFQEAQTKLWRSEYVTVEVSVYRDGSRSYQLVSS